MKRRLTHALLVAMLLTLTAALPLAYARQGVSVKIGKQATLADGGRAVDLSIKVVCPAGRDVLEAFAYVSQDGNQSSFSPIPLVCDGRSQRQVVRVTAFPDSPAFQPGVATASAFILVLDPATGGTETGQDSQTINIR
jgi:hypothetical protein